MKLNTKTKVTNIPVYTHEGGIAKRLTPILELKRAVLSTMLWEGQFYESGVEITNRIKDLIPKVNPAKVSSIAIETRNQGKLRHIPLFLAREMARYDSYKPYVTNTLFNIIQRPDELNEFLKIYWKDGKCPLAASVKKGLAKAFTKFDEYALSKWNRDADIKLRDVLFLTHAKPVDGYQGKLWKKLIGGFCEKCWEKNINHKNKKHDFVEAKLKIPDTWEVAISASEGDNEKDVWEDLLRREKLGGLALLRNLRNFRNNNVDINLIRKALFNVKVDRILPYRFITAAKYAPNLEPELEQAMFKSIKDNGNKISGKTKLLIDTSGSMSRTLSSNSESTRLDAACGLAILARELFEDVEIYTFSKTIRQVPSRRGFALRDAIINSQPHLDTYLGAAVNKLNNIGYDRLIVFSDEESGDTVGKPIINSKSYMINIASGQYGVGYGDWTRINGFSESVLDYIIELEKLSGE